MGNLPPAYYCCGGIVVIVVLGLVFLGLCAVIRSGQISEARRKAGLEE